VRGHFLGFRHIPAPKSTEHQIQIVETNQGFGSIRAINKNMGLLRYQIFIVYIIAFSSIWISLLSQKEMIIQTLPIWIPKSYTENKQLDNIVSNLIDFAPLILLISLGVYAIFSIGYGVLRLRTCHEASVELEHQIKEARQDMIRRGVIPPVKA
jgi:hypothetical protein